jgi:hypothetical protein
MPTVERYSRRKRKRMRGIITTQSGAPPPGRRFSGTREVRASQLSQNRHPRSAPGRLRPLPVFTGTPEHPCHLLRHAPQDIPALDLERSRIVSASLAMSRAEKDRLLPDLRAVEVHALGVDGAGKDIAYWQASRDFWTA